MNKIVSLAAKKVELESKLKTVEKIIDLKKTGAIFLDSFRRNKVNVIRSFIE